MVDLIRKLADVLERGTRVRLILAMIGSVVTAMLDTVAIGLVLPLVDIATSHGITSGPAKIAAGLVGTQDPAVLTAVLTCVVVGLFILKNIGMLVFNWWLMGFVFFERVRTSARILSFYLTAPYTEISRRSSAELMRTMDASVLQVFSLSISGLMTAFASILSMVAVGAGLLIVAPLATAALITYFSLAIALYLRLVKPKAAAAGRDMNVASVAGWKAAFAALGSLKEVKLRGSQDVFVQAYREAQLRGSRAGRIAAVLGSLPRYILEILFILAIGVVLMIGTMGTGSDSSGAFGLLAVFVAAGFRVLPSISAFVVSASNIRVGADSVDIVRTEVLKARSHLGEARSDEPPLGFEQSLTVETVSFRYPGSDRDVLTDVSFSMPLGTSLAIVGGSGAGKTTLIDLILGLHQPTSGAILVDGVDISTCQQRWGKNIGYVPQETFILDATLLENIAFDVPAHLVDEERVAGAIDHAQLRDLVDSLPDGLNSEVGERGGRLSGGQRQRLGIARALYRSPRLLVLDEATSALDNETEHEISQAVSLLAGSVSVIVVAHRLSTVRDVDRILFLKDGQLASSGTFEQMRHHDADFERLVRLGSLDVPARS